MKTSTIICICDDFSKPLMDTISSDSIALCKDEILEVAIRQYQAYELKADTLVFKSQKNFFDFKDFVLEKLKNCN